MDNPNLDLNRSTPTIDPAQEQLIRSVVSKLLVQREDPVSAKCLCHWLDCSKTPVLLWKNGNTFTLKIATQKLVGFARKDKHGTEYWRFRNDEELNEKQEVDKKVQTPNSPPVELPEVKPEVKKDPEAEKVQLEDFVSVKQLGNETSEMVNKFQAKYGTATEPKRD